MYLFSDELQILHDNGIYIFKSNGYLYMQIETLNEKNHFYTVEFKAKDSEHRKVLLENIKQAMDQRINSISPEHQDAFKKQVDFLLKVLSPQVESINNSASEGGFENVME